MSDQTYDAIVVGGRVAGALSAAHLAERGLSVLVLESGHFPSATLSTHFFRGDGLVRSLDRLGVLETLVAQAPPLTCEYFFAGGAADAETNPAQEPGDAGFGLSVRRETLDHLVASRVAALPNVDFRTGVRVADVLSEDGTVTGVRDETGESHRATVTVGADGRRSGVARRVEADIQERHDGVRGIYYCYVNGWTRPDGGPADGPEFSLSGNEMAYVFPSDAGTTCIALSVSAQEFELSRRDMPAYFRSRLAAHAGLWPRFQAAPSDEQLFAAMPEDSVVRAACGPGWALVGDAGTHQDPWSGFGMDTAARQAEALGSAMTSDASSWNSTYAQARDDVTLPRFHSTVTAAPDLSVLLG